MPAGRLTRAGSPAQVRGCPIFDGPADRVVRSAWVDGMAGLLDQGQAGAYVNFLGDEGPERVRAA